MCQQGSVTLEQWRLGVVGLRVAGSSTMDPLQHHPCSLPYISTACQPGPKDMACCPDQVILYRQEMWAYRQVWR